ncbi:MAG: TetR/AcrR family transcriptional regulator [Myxococcales bacterium]|nr:TetR/AcrR family transcriptional regulator [Myxococcales bacterium]
MGRSPHISDAQILQAAEELFLERGFGVSTAAIAERAGVSEGTLFKRFPKKTELFVHAMDVKAIEGICAHVDALDDAAEVHDALVTLVERLVEKFRIVLPRMMMMWANVPPRDVFAAYDEPPPLRVFRSICLWLRREKERGRIAVDDERVLARLIVGSSLHFTFFELMGFGADSTAGAFADRLANIVLRGVRPLAMEGAHEES